MDIPEVLCVKNIRKRHCSLRVLRSFCVPTSVSDAGILGQRAQLLLAFQREGQHSEKWLRQVKIQAGITRVVQRRRGFLEEELLWAIKRGAFCVE